MGFVFFSSFFRFKMGDSRSLGSRRGTPFPVHVVTVGETVSAIRTDPNDGSVNRLMRRSDHSPNGWGGGGAPE